MNPTPAMTEADRQQPSVQRASDMADAFHPSQFITGTGSVRTSHSDDVFDAIEAALLYAAGRIPLRDLLAAFGEDHDPGRAVDG